MFHGSSWGQFENLTAVRKYRWRSSKKMFCTSAKYRLVSEVLAESIVYLYSTKQLKLFINVFIDIGKSIDIAVSQLYCDVMKSLF